MRDKIIKEVRLDLVGPSFSDDKKTKEQLLVGKENPFNQFISGILEPQRVSAENYEGDITDDNSIVNVSGNNNIEGISDEGLSFTNTSKSSFGFSFLSLKKDIDYLIETSFATYERMRWCTTCNHELAKENIIRDINSQKCKKCDSKLHKGSFAYKRIQHHYQFELKNNIPLQFNEERIFTLPDHDIELILINRTVENQYFDYKNQALLSLSILNKKVHNSPKPPKYYDCYYQVELSIKNKLESSFQEYPEPIIHDSWDNNMNNLLYRDIKTYATGHSCAVDWMENKNGFVTCIASNFIPEHEMKPLLHCNIDNNNLKMYELSKDGWKKDKSFKLLEAIPTNYIKWINNKNKEIFSNKYHEDQSKINLDNCSVCATRIEEGINILKSNDKALLAFQFMNNAMLDQQLRYSLPPQKWNLSKDSNEDYIEDNILPVLNDISTWPDYTKKNPSTRFGKWRLFQLAFILMNVKSMTILESNDREIVDLIWFPTGGGKTEAYLGLSAFTIFYNKIVFNRPAATEIIMRYTLRLLTAQQFERACSLIMSCEKLRKGNTEILGNDEISIGVYVGESLTPNKNDKAIKLIEDLNESGYSQHYKFLLLKCPNCGKELGPIYSNKINRSKGIYIDTDNSTKFKCYGNCEYANSNFPVYVVDEDIYNKPPTMIIATVDKFAQLPHQSKIRKLFGIDVPDVGNHNPPSLIIQDELHLISGPLGSMVGHYEGVLQELMKNTQKVKIIASTATIAMAKEQIRNLYAKKDEHIKTFPPPGISHDDSFFSKLETDMIGRKYIGIYANSSPSFSTTQVRLYSILLQASKMFDEKNTDLQDSYHTMLCYYSSLKELGHAKTMIEDDVKSLRLNTLYTKLNLNPKYRRYVNNIEELTSRKQDYEIPRIMANLGKKGYIDACLATNMISVGLDIQRLSLMCCVCQPKSTAEYIQATSRVGRSANKPGLVFTLYNTARARDMSHYENFKSYHSKIYTHVEPMSLTPFSVRVRDRAIEALLIGFLRNHIDQEHRNDEHAQEVRLNEKIIQKFKIFLEERITFIDEKELESAKNELAKVLDKWRRLNRIRFHTWQDNPNRPPLFINYGQEPNPRWKPSPFFVPSSMRNVDKETPLFITGLEEDG